MAGRKIRKMIAVMLVTVTALSMMTGCQSEQKKTETKAEKKEEINASTASYEDMVSYLEEKGFIKKDCEPVNINETSGYLQDNTGGQYTDTKVADKAYDYDGLWLFWWDQKNQSDLYENYESMGMNQGTIVIAGGAAILETEAQNGAFAIAFSDDYVQKQDAIDIFKSLKSE